jgi:hypothetical protein
MDIQDIIAYGLVVLAAAFLVKKYFLPKKKAPGCGGDDCKCH